MSAPLNPSDVLLNTDREERFLAAIEQRNVRALKNFFEPGGDDLEEKFVSLLSQCLRDPASISFVKAIEVDFRRLDIGKMIEELVSFTNLCNRNAGSNNLLLMYCIGELDRIRDGYPSCANMMDAKGRSILTAAAEQGDNNTLLDLVKEGKVSGLQTEPLQQFIAFVISGNPSKRTRVLSLTRDCLTDTTPYHRDAEMSPSLQIFLGCPEMQLELKKFVEAFPYFTPHEAELKETLKECAIKSEQLRKAVLNIPEFTLPPAIVLELVDYRLGETDPKQPLPPSLQIARIFSGSEDVVIDKSLYPAEFFGDGPGPVLMDKRLHDQLSKKAARTIGDFVTSASARKVSGGRGDDRFCNIL